MMRLNKASLTLSQTGPWGQGYSAAKAEPPTRSPRSLICLKWRPSEDDLALPAPREPSAGLRSPKERHLHY